MYYIKIELGISDLEICSKDISETQVHILSSKSGHLLPRPKNLFISEEENTLTVKEEFGDQGFSLKDIGKFFTEEYKSVYLRVEIPSSYLIENVYLSLSTGDLRIHDFACSNIEMKLKAGDIKCENVTFDKVSAHLAAGDLKLLGNFKEIDANLTAGDMKISPSSLLQTANLNAALGDIKLELPNLNTYALFPSLGLGKIKYKGFNEPVEFLLDAEKRISVNVKMGDLKIYHSF